MLSLVGWTLCGDVCIYVCVLCSFYRALVSRDDCGRTGLEHYSSLCYEVEKKFVGPL
jgi:hypothetical protein